MTTFNDTFTAVVGGLTQDRSKFKAATYTRVDYTDEQLLNAYEGSSLVSRVVDMPAEDETRMWREWQAEAEQITAIEDIETIHRVQQKVLEARQDARLFGDGYLYIDDGRDPSELLVPDVSPGLRFLAKVDRWQISEGEYDFDPMSEYYNRPSYYDLIGSNTQILRIHPSRVVHCVGRKRKSFGASTRLGQSVVAPMFDDLKGFDAVMANVADMTMEAKVDVMKIQGLMQKVTDPDELSALQTKLQLAMYSKATNGALILDMDDEDWQQKQITFTTLPDIIDRFQMAAAGAAQIPRSRLFGVQTGGLGNAGESDTADYYDRIKSTQENEITPAMRILDDMIIKAALGSIPPEVHYNWRSLYQQDPKVQQEIGTAITNRYVSLFEKGIFPIELAFDQVVNELTEAGVSPGLEAAAEEWRNALDNDAGDLDEGADEGMIDA